MAHICATVVSNIQNAFEAVRCRHEVNWMQRSQVALIRRRKLLLDTMSLDIVPFWEKTNANAVEQIFTAPHLYWQQIIVGSFFYCGVFWGWAKGFKWIVKHITCKLDYEINSTELFHIEWNGHSIIIHIAHSQMVHHILCWCEYNSSGSSSCMIV